MPKKEVRVAQSEFRLKLECHRIQQLQHSLSIDGCFQLRNVFSADVHLQEGQIVTCSLMFRSRKGLVTDLEILPSMLTLTPKVFPFAFVDEKSNDRCKAPVLTFEHFWLSSKQRISAPNGLSVLSFLKKSCIVFQRQQLYSFRNAMSYSFSYHLFAGSHNKVHIKSTTDVCSEFLVEWNHQSSHFVYGSSLSQSWDWLRVSGKRMSLDRQCNINIEDPHAQGMPAGHAEQFASPFHNTNRFGVWCKGNPLSTGSFCLCEDALSNFSKKREEDFWGIGKKIGV